jgi:hypothetical protein
MAFRRMKILACSCALVVGCSFSAPDVVPTDGPVDMPGPEIPPNACMTWAPLNVEDPCSVQLGTPEVLVLNAGTYTLDTDTGMLSGGSNPHVLAGAKIAQQQAGPMVRVVNLASLMVNEGAELDISGSVGVIFVVHGSAGIGGIVDAGAHLFGTPGTSVPGPGGSDATVCNGTKIGTGGNGTAAADSAAGGGGAGGGAFGETGGNGTDGNNGGHGVHGVGGVKLGTADLVPLIGGCAGGTGGDDSSAALASGGRKGDGGGAIEITALEAVSVTGSLLANGLGGGGAGPERAGGGGAGSGGGILLDGAGVTLTGTAKLCANGGGGGEGGLVTVAGVTGDNGACSETAPATGGRSAIQGGDGGDGGYGGMPKGTNALAAMGGAGGGGGGGSVGRVHIRSRGGAPVIDPASIVTPNAM